MEMKKVSISYGVVVLIFIAILSACAGSTKLIGSWTDRSYEGGHVKSILIVGLTKNTTARKLYEDTFSNRFSKAGINTIASMSVIAPEKELDKDTIKSTAVGKSMKAVLITHLEASGKKEIFIPGPTGPPGDARRFSNYIPTVYGSEYSLGGYQKKEFVKLITNLYETSTEKLLWTGASESIDPESDKSIIDELVVEVIVDLRKNNLIK